MKTYLHTAISEDEQDPDELAVGAVKGVATTHEKQEGKMPKEAVATGGATTQLATRVPSVLYKRVKVFVVESDTSIMEFVGAALAAELARRGGGAKYKVKG